MPTARFAHALKFRKQKPWPHHNFSASPSPEILFSGDSDLPSKFWLAKNCLSPEFEYPNAMWNLSWQIHKRSHRIFLVVKKWNGVKKHIHQMYALPLLSARNIPNTAKAWAWCIMTGEEINQELWWLGRLCTYEAKTEINIYTILCYVTCRPKHSLSIDVWCRWLLLAVTGTVHGGYILNSHCYLQGSKTRHVIKYWWGDKETKLFCNCSLDPFSNRWLSWRDFGKSRSVNKLLISEHHKKMPAVN